MKRKFLILTLCFTIIFSSINFKKSYADGGVISLPILATVSALAVGTGIVISGNDDLYDIGRIFYDYIDRHNDLTWATVQSVFTSSVSLQPNKLVSVKSEFLDIVKEFFDNTFGSSGDLPVYTELIYPNFHPLTSGNFVYYEVFDNSTIPHGGNSYEIKLLKNDGTYHSLGNYGHGFKSLCFAPSTVYGKTTLYLINSNDEVREFNVNLNPSEAVIFSSVFSYQGGYTWDNVESKKENEIVALPVPGDLSSLVGQGSTDFWDNTDNLVGSGDISIPNVENPSISLDNTISFPNTNVDTNNPSIPDVDAPTVDGILPAFPSFGDSLDFSPMYLTNVTNKFPFSLPWDIGRLLQQFDVEPVAPVFEVPIVSESITLDLTEFSELASIVRFFVLIGFILALIFISTKLMA